MAVPFQSTYLVQNPNILGSYEAKCSAWGHVLFLIWFRHPQPTASLQLLGIPVK